MQTSRISSAVFSVVLATTGLSASGQEISLKARESADIGTVYWIKNCQSTLKEFAGVDLLEGPQGVELAIREESVSATRQNCANKVSGGTVVLSAKEIPTKFSGTIKYRVRYKTEDGEQQSSHSKKIALYPN